MGNSLDKPRHQDRHNYDHAPEESHPSWGLLGVNRMSSGTGTTLFDSDIAHRNVICVTLSRAIRRRSLMRFWHGARTELFEVWMSEAQWGAFVSSFGQGDGVPVTLHRVMGEPMPEPPRDGRLQDSFKKVRTTAADAVQDVKEAFDEFTVASTAKERKERLHTLEARINNLVPNMVYAAKTLAETAEDVVVKAKADIEAMVVAKASALGLTDEDALALVEAVVLEDHEETSALE